MNGTLTFQKEKFEDIFDDMIPILKEHYLEIAHWHDIKFEPDVDFYYKMEDAKKIVFFTAREDGELIGYNIFFLKNNPHYKSSYQATNDVIYIRKDKRGFGRDFIKWCDEELKKIGVQVVFHHIKFANDWSVMLERNGYEKIDIIMGKRLDK